MPWLRVVVCLCLAALACAQAGMDAVHPAADAAVVDAPSVTDAQAVDARPPDATPPDASPPDAAPAQACMAGSSTQTFTPFMAGCAGSVTWTNRAWLCGAGRVPCPASAWVDGHGATPPAHSYWTDDDLRYSGAAGSCSVSATVGSTCTGTPMRVCSGGTDPEGNVCNWTDCGWQATTPDQYFGGCFNNTTAGTLCCIAACADGSVEDAFGGGMAGCAGSVAFTARASLCGTGYHVCSAAEYVAKRAGQAPTHEYWTDDVLLYGGTGTGSCSVSTATGTACAAGSPMRVCSGPSDAEGNSCMWSGCGFNQISPSEYFGGCTSNPTAGALCCAP